MVNFAASTSIRAITLMHCPACLSRKTRKLKTKTVLSYHQFYCRECRTQFNERTGTPLNFIEYPTEIVMLVVYHYYRFKLSLDDVVELMAIRGVHLSHQTVHNWAQTFGTDLGIKLRSVRRRTAGSKWHIDATYIKVDGHWCYLYRAIDKEGNLVDVRLSDTRDQAAAEAFFNQCHETTDVTPEQITTDKEPALYPALENTLSLTKHRDVKYKNNNIEQDHRGIKSRYEVMKGFCGIFTAIIFCTTFEEIRQLFRMENKTRAERRKIIPAKFQEFKQVFVTN